MWPANGGECAGSRRAAAAPARALPGAGHLDSYYGHIKRLRGVKDRKRDARWWCATRCATWCTGAWLSAPSAVGSRLEEGLTRWPGPGNVSVAAERARTPSAAVSA